jgi:hypothetical protein
MSSPPFAPGVQPRPAAAPRPSAPKPKRLRWTWLERFLLAQSLLPALLFVPGISAARVVIRMALFLTPLAVWFAIIQSGRSKAGSDTYPAGFCLKLICGLLGLLIFHWGTPSIPAGAAQATFYIAVFSPAFWAPKGLESSRQINRLMAILLICNGISSALALGQVFRPETFNPPFIPGITGMPEDSISVQSLTYTDQFGRRIIRPCGLSDTAGAGALASTITVLVGLATALRPIGKLKRLACLAVAFCGMAVIYYSQVRMVFVMAIICLAVLAGIFVLQKNFGYATLLGGLGAAMVVGALTWVMATSGRVVVERFLGLTEQSFTKSYGESRGGFVNFALTVQMWNDPLGHGIGCWGAAPGLFSKGTGVWVEVMITAWVVDGGIPLLVLYSVAVVLAMLDTLRIALRSRDRDVRFWAAVVFASNLGVIATCFSFITFVTTIGMQFWFLAALVHAADYQTRREAAIAMRARRPPPRPPAPPPFPSPYPAAPA